MQGRYGVDEFYNFLLIFYLVLVLVNCFVHSSLLYLFSIALLVYGAFRVFSKNIGARQKENAKFLIIKRRVSDKLSIIKKRVSDKEHVYRTCPHCKATLRFPKKKGTHDAVCPRCKNSLKIKI